MNIYIYTYMFIIAQVFGNDVPAKIASLASTGSDGRHPGNIHRDAFRHIKCPVTLLEYVGVEQLESGR